MKRFYLFLRFLTQCALLLPCCHLTPAFANPDDNTKKHAREIQRLTFKAEKGDITAMRQLGLLHMKGKNIKKDPKTAMIWLKKAAKKGDHVSMMHVGDLYRKGKGVRKNPQHALKYYIDSFNALLSKNSKLQSDNSLPVIQRIKKLPLNFTVSWWINRCQTGDACAMYFLATLPHNERKDYINETVAQKYLINSAQKGNQQAKETIEAAPRMQYLPYWEAIVKKDNKTDTYNLAMALYNDGNCTPEAKSKAEEYFILAAEAGNKEAEQWIKKLNPVLAKNIEVDRKFQYQGGSPKNLEATYKLIDAASVGRYWEYEDYIKEGADINFFDDNKTCSAFAHVITLACKDGKTDGLKIMLKHSPNIYHCNRFGGSIFQHIWESATEKLNYDDNRINVRPPYTEAITELLINYIDSNEIINGKLSMLFPDGNSPIIDCALSGYVNSLKKLLSKGVSPDDCVDATALSLIILNIFKPAVHGVQAGRVVGPYHRLEFYRANADIVNFKGILECFNILLENGANINHIYKYTENDILQYRTPLLNAIFSDIEPIAIRLIKRGANPNLIIHDNVNLLGYAIRNKSVDPKYIRLLIEAGGDISHDSEAMSILEKDEELMYIYKKRR